jgi:hypothetical protein
VLSGIDGDLELGADPVIGCHQDGILEAGPLEVEQRAETAQVGIRAKAARAGSERLDGLHQGIAGIDVDAGITVGNGWAVVPVVRHGKLWRCSQILP